MVWGSQEKGPEEGESELDSAGQGAAEQRGEGSVVGWG